jgi:diaminohydroxyphosphoribosylaminopyrimidine deaminase/5-amino-6-(5-phosphoribosylamino)uracil reductase
MNQDDRKWMSRALELAERGRGAVEPNPLVGAVVVRDGALVGEGWHQRFGGPHAEVFALGAAGEAARGATLYTTLEPCCHHGKTPPCTDAVLKAGIARVVTAMRDPFPLVSGRGVDILQSAGLTVEVGLAEEEARRLNAPFLTLLGKKRPYIHLKWAMTLDGKIATRTGDSKWISGEASRRRVHELRGRVDGVLVGIGTVLADDPLLTARPPGPRVATRIVLDSQGRLQESSQLVRTARETPTLVVSAKPQTALAERGCEVLVVPSDDKGVSLTALLEELGQRRMTNLLVEGGAGVLGSFLDARLVDEVHVFLAPRLAGGRDARTAIAGIGVERMAEALALSDVRVERVEEDVYLHGLAGSL